MAYRMPLAILALLLVLPVPAAFADGGDPNLVHACVHQVAGNVRIVAPAENCRPPESPLHWSAQGSSGGGVGGIQLFTADGSFTVPAGVMSVLVELWGGGGGAGMPPSGIGSLDPGAGGGGGGYVRTVLAVSPGQVVPVTVGQGGAANCGVNGGAGGDTTFGALASAEGGQGGMVAGVAGTGGSASPAAISVAGQAGHSVTAPGTSGHSAQGTFAFPGRNPGKGGFQSLAVGTGCNSTSENFGTGQPGQVIVQW